jgi:ubiquinone biosynthesis monooxygenase Coq7
MKDICKPFDNIHDLPRWLVAELRSDHAGETGAVYIYRGILAITRNRSLHEFAWSHLGTERRHLETIETFLPPIARSRLLPLWRASGYLLGAIPAMLGARATYATIAAVETFVDLHYRQQIDRLQEECTLPELQALLDSFREDEVDHKEEAEQALATKPGWLLRAWSALVGSGSSAAVSVARWC